MSNIVYRKIKASDNIEIAAVIRAVLTEHGLDIPGTVFTDPTTDELFETFNVDKAEYWVVEVDDVIVGGSGLYPTSGLDDDCTELVKLYLLNACRGLGIGKELMRIVIEEAGNLGYNKVYLESLPELSEAIGLYNHMGFKMLDHSLGDSGHFACRVWMLKNLKTRKKNENIY